MRKVLISLTVSLLLLVLMASSVMAGGVIKFGVELPGTMEFSTKEPDKPKTGIELDTKMGFSVAGEYFFDLNEKLALGVGAEYQLTRKTERYDFGYYYLESEFNYIPIYALSRCQIDSTFYVTGKTGYNVMQIKDCSENEELKGGLFYGIGGGAILSDVLQIEVLYSTNNGAIKDKDSDDKLDVKYSKLGVSVGYKF